MIGQEIQSRARLPTKEDELIKVLPSPSILPSIRVLASFIMLKHLRQRESGFLTERSPVLFETIEADRRLSALDLAKFKDFESVHKTPVVCGNVDPTECRYFISGENQVFDQFATLQLRGYCGSKGGILAVLSYFIASRIL